jgi:hypothetical protein
MCALQIAVWDAVHGVDLYNMAIPSTSIHTYLRNQAFHDPAAQLWDLQLAVL